MSSLEIIYLNVSLSWRKTFRVTWEKELYFLRELFTVFSSQKPNGSVSFKMQCHFGTKSQNISPRKCQWITFILLWIYSFGQTLLQHDLTFWIVSFPLRLPICKSYVPWKYLQPPLLNMQVLLRFVLASVSLCKGTSLGSKICPRLPPGLWSRAIPGTVCLQLGRIRPGYDLLLSECLCQLALRLRACYLHTKFCFPSYLHISRALSWKFLLVPVNVIARRFLWRQRNCSQYGQE